MTAHGSPGSAVRGDGVRGDGVRGDGISRPAGSSSWAQFPPHVLREYSLLADGRRGALCGPRGEIVWLCVPRWDSPAVFSSLTGGEGIFAVTPVEPCVWGGYYEPGTLIWRNRWITLSTRLECRDALAFPGGTHETVILRSVQAIEATTTVRLELDLRADFGRHRMRGLRRDDHGVWTASSGNVWARLSGAWEATYADGRLVAEITVPAGGSRDLMLELSDRPLRDLAPAAGQRWARTEAAWQAAMPALDHAVGQRDARHAYAVLRGLTTPGGGTVAAATLGLPERAEQGRDYDYRYVWLRDQAYAGLACGVDEPLPLFHEAVSAVSNLINEHGPHPAPAYRVDGTPLPHESALELSGYPGGADVVGNWVNGQYQLDALGDVVQLLGTALGFDALDKDGRHALDLAVASIAERWREPEAGIWELDDDWWTQSRLACVAGLSTAAPYLPRGRASVMRGLADTILTDTTRRCLHASGRWQRSVSDDGLDASLVLPPVRGALPAADPRTINTLIEVQRHLVEDGHVYRFAHSDKPLGQDEGAFVLCGLMTALACWHQGDLPQAVHYFERARAACGPPGLFSEEYDVQQRQLRGNLPQAFVHAGLLETAQRLTRPPDLGLM